MATTDRGLMMIGSGRDAVRTSSAAYMSAAIGSPDCAGPARAIPPDASRSPVIVHYCILCWNPYYYYRTPQHGSSPCTMPGHPLLQDYSAAHFIIIRT